MNTDSAARPFMHAIRVPRFGGIEVMEYVEVARPRPASDELLVRVEAAGVGPWDAWVRAGKSVISQPLPLTPGADISGTVAQVGDGVSGFARGDLVFGVTNANFTGGYADYALAKASMMAPKPPSLGHVAAASLPVTACTAWQMLFERGGVKEGSRILVHGGAGSVGACLVQFAKGIGAHVTATARAQDLDYVKSLGADAVIDTAASRFEDHVANQDVVLDTVGGELQMRSFGVLRAGGGLVSIVHPPDTRLASKHDVLGTFLLVDVRRDLIERIASWVVSGRLKPVVGEVLGLDQARLAHEMLDGRPHKHGKIVLVPKMT